MPSVAKLGYFNTVVKGCFSYPREATPITWYLTTRIWISWGKFWPPPPPPPKCILQPEHDFYRVTPSKRHWASFGIVSNWVGFVVKTWQPCLAALWWNLHVIVRMLMAVGPRQIIRGYKSVIKTVCRLDRQNMSEDNTMKARCCQELVANYQDKRLWQSCAADGQQ